MAKNKRQVDARRKELIKDLTEYRDAMRSLAEKSEQVVSLCSQILEKSGFSLPELELEEEEDESSPEETITDQILWEAAKIHYGLGGKNDRKAP